MARITLKTKVAGEKLISGVHFIDGKAESVLGPHTRAYFEAIGATVSDAPAKGKASKRKTSKPRPAAPEDMEDVSAVEPPAE